MLSGSIRKEQLHGNSTCKEGGTQGVARHQETVYIQQREAFKAR